MGPRVRPARLEDLPSITPWTTVTFAWGDYIPERFGSWIESENSEVLVCVDETDTPTAMVHARMVSANEGWLEGARVRPDHQRAGLGSILNDAGVDWVRAHGARVVRLAIEDDNQAANNQVVKLGYRLGSEWVTGFGEPRAASPVSEHHRLRPAGAGDVEPSWMFWSTSDLAGAGRGLLHEGWVWRKAFDRDVFAAASQHRFYQSRAGWVIRRANRPEVLETMWLAIAPEDFPALIEGIMGLAHELGASETEIKAPALDWVVESFRRAGQDTNRVNVYCKPIL